MPKSAPHHYALEERYQLRVDDLPKVDNVPNTHDERDIGDVQDISDLITPLEQENMLDELKVLEDCRSRL
eukprot:12409769-Heterocapsa_arctica.AAC.2